MSQESLVRGLGFREAGALVIGSVIGTGIFLKTAGMAQVTGSFVWVLGAWLVAGVSSLIGAFCYGELGARFPQAGGEYVFLREAYGGLISFLFGWMRFWIGSPGSIAAYGVAAATFLGGIFVIDTAWVKSSIAVGAIALFSLSNCVSVLFGGRLQSWLTLLKLLMIITLTSALLIHARNIAFEHFVEASGGQWPGWSAFGTAMLAALWAFDGWNNMPMAAGEIHQPTKNIPRALIGGMSAVLVLYLLANTAYFAALPFQEVLSSYSRIQPAALPIATKAASLAFGSWVTILLSAGFVISCCGSLNGSILTGARVPFAMARDKIFFRRLSEVSHTTRVPVASIIVQGVIASILALSGTFDQLTDYVIFSSWIFYALTVGSIFIFRRKKQSVPTYRVPAFPWLPALFIIVSLLLLVNTLLTATQESAIGLGFIVLGIPVYYFYAKAAKK